MSAMVKLKPSTHARLQEIAKEQHKPMGEVITYLGKACVRTTSG